MSTHLNRTQESHRKTHRALERPPFERIALMLQGGGALGAYQAGVYEALSEARLDPDWVAGISIGAINSALIAGNPPATRVEKLRRFWELVTATPLWGGAGLLARDGKNGPTRDLAEGATSLGVPTGTPPSNHAEDLYDFWNTVAANALSVWPYDATFFAGRGDVARGLANQMSAGLALMRGAPGFFAPRLPVPWLHPAGTIEATSYYDSAPLKATLERLVDFDRINAGAMRFSVGAVNVSTGNFVYFDTRTHSIGPEHVMASGALPPGFPAVEIEGEHYWDGGLVSNTPLQWVLESEPRQDTLAFQVDLWSARGPFPHDAGSSDPAEGDPVFEPHPRQLRSLQVFAEDTFRALEPARETPRGAQGGRGVRRAKPARRSQSLQPDSADLPVQATRGRLEGLRILAVEHGGALAGRLPGYDAHAPPSRSARSTEDPRRRHDLRPRSRRP
jgi:predicted acylesterase/phospholipase RssA